MYFDGTLTYKQHRVDPTVLTCSKKAFQSWIHMYNEQLKLKADSPLILICYRVHKSDSRSSCTSRQWLQNSSLLTFIFRSGNTIVFPTRQCAGRRKHEVDWTLLDNSLVSFWRVKVHFDSRRRQWTNDSFRFEISRSPLDGRFWLWCVSRSDVVFNGTWDIWCRPVQVFAFTSIVASVGCGSTRAVIFILFNLEKWVSNFKRA